MKTTVNPLNAIVQAAKAVETAMTYNDMRRHASSVISLDGYQIAVSTSHRGVPDFDVEIIEAK